MIDLNEYSNIDTINAINNESLRHKLQINRSTKRAKKKDCLSEVDRLKNINSKKEQRND